MAPGSQILPSADLFRPAIAASTTLQNQRAFYGSGNQTSTRKIPKTAVTRANPATAMIWAPASAEGGSRRAKLQRLW